MANSFGHHALGIVFAPDVTDRRHCSPPEATQLLDETFQAVPARDGLSFTCLEWVAGTA
jgi:hypothetical protein